MDEEVLENQELEKISENHNPLEKEGIGFNLFLADENVQENDSQHVYFFFDTMGDAVSQHFRRIGRIRKAPERLLTQL